MIELKNYLFGILRRYDCHANLSGKNALDPYPAFSESSILFIDNDIKNLDDSLIPYADILETDRFTKQYNISLVGKDKNETIELFKKYDPSLIGEVKCFKHYVDSDGKEKVYENYNIALCKEIKHLPMFIHFDLIENDLKLREIIESNPERPVVLCHCGLNDLDDKTNAFEKAVALQHEYNNLWLEVSWVAWEYIGKDHRKMSLIDTDRLLLGTDFSKFTTQEEIAKTLELFDYWSGKINIKRNIIKLLRNAGKEQKNEY